MKQDIWVLYDPHNKSQTEKMPTEDMQFSLLKLKTRHINQYLIWKNEWPKWKKLNEFLDSDDSPFMSTFLLKGNDKDVNTEAKSPLNMKPADAETAQLIRDSFSSVQLEDIGLDKILAHNRVSFNAEEFAENAPLDVKPQLNFKNLVKGNNQTQQADQNKNKIELLLIHPKGTLFRTSAHDISLSGTFTEKIVPDEFHHSVFDLVIVNNLIKDDQLKRLTLKAKVLITDTSIFLQYVEMTEAQKNSLRAALDYYVRSMKKATT